MERRTGMDKTDGEAMAAFAGRAAEGPFYMLNLLEFRPDGGAEHYGEYGIAVAPLLERAGGKAIFAGRPSESADRRWLLGHDAARLLSDSPGVHGHGLLAGVSRDRAPLRSESLVRSELRAMDALDANELPGGRRPAAAAPRRGSPRPRPRRSAIRPCRRSGSRRARRTPSPPAASDPSPLNRARAGATGPLDLGVDPLCVGVRAIDPGLGLLGLGEPVREVPDPRHREMLNGSRGGLAGGRGDGRARRSGITTPATPATSAARQTAPRLCGPGSGREPRSTPGRRRRRRGRSGPRMGTGRPRRPRPDDPRSPEPLELLGGSVRRSPDSMTSPPRSASATGRRP